MISFDLRLGADCRGTLVSIAGVRVEISNDMLFLKNGGKHCKVLASRAAQILGGMM
jgi:hypothetical protein